MTEGFMTRDYALQNHFYAQKGQYTAGHAIGILHLEVWYPLVPGNVVNATTYPFPVRYKLIQGATQALVHRGDPCLLNNVLHAGKQLQSEGVRAIVGACGYLGYYQRQAAEAIDIPVFLSSLLQVPLVKAGLKPGQSIGILCADSASLTERLLNACGFDNETQVVIKGLEDKPQFQNIVESRGEFNYREMEQEVVQGAIELLEEEPRIGALVLECSDMPPFSWAVQSRTRLPVFDFITMIKWIYSSVVQKPYAGII